MNFQLYQTGNQRKLWQKFAPVSRPAATDTYKRTMATTGQIFAENAADYSLAARLGLQEDGANGRLVMAGLEKTLYPWFIEPITDAEMEEAKKFFLERANTKRFAKEWEMVRGNGGYMPIDIYSLPGGQTFLTGEAGHVPMLVAEGPGSLVSHIEPQLVTIYAPVIEATKARIIEERLGDVIEFGLRSSRSIPDHHARMISLYVGGGIAKTSDDEAVLLFPKYFTDVGTTGHEFIMAYQREGKTLEEAQEAAFEDFVSHNDFSVLLTDTIDTKRSGIPAVIRMKEKYRGKTILPRFDSGDLADQCVYWGRICEDLRVEDRRMVVEDGITPEKGQRIRDAYTAAGFDPKDIIFGVGGYFEKGVTRDAISLAYKRSATLYGDKLEKQIKFSDAAGKISMPGRIRIYGDGDTLVVAQHDEEVGGEPLMIKVVENGRLVYNETLEAQRARALRTWDAYRKVEYSRKTKELIEGRMSEKRAMLAAQN